LTNPDGILKKMDNLSIKFELNPQQLKVFELIGYGASNYEIAEELFISLSTVRSHLKSIYAKLGFENRTSDYRPRLKLFLIAREYLKKQ